MFTKLRQFPIWLFIYWTSGEMVSGYGTGGSTIYSRPNIIIIVADDMGFNDVSFHGQDQILTPNIDALAYHGIILNKYYTPPLCTPSRAALLTGRYPINTGMQHFVIPSDEPWGLPLKETIMPEILQKSGYSTYMVGKWHLGFHKKAFTPTLRGFDSHFGYLGPYIDYYDHSLEMKGKPYARGYDMRKNLTVHYDTKGTYATDLFTNEAVNVIRCHNQNKPLFLYLPHLAPHTANEDNPMQAPRDIIEKFKHIKDPKRRIYAAMLHKLDEGIGRVVEALSETKMLDNSIIIFYSDNGGPSIGLHSNSASNHPLRGQKGSPWEGGVRTAGLIWSPYLQQRHQTVSTQMMHVTDWLPTIASAAGIKLPPQLELDGKDLWFQLQNGYPSARWNIVHNIDEIIGYSAFTVNKLKYINGSTDPSYNTWLGNITNEKDPRSVNYAQTVLNSTVNLVLKKFNLENYMSELTETKIVNLRKTAIVQCPKLNVTREIECNPLVKPCLFDIEADPCERYNLAPLFPQEVDKLAEQLEYYRLRAAKPVRVPADPNCDPRRYNFTWTWWQEGRKGGAVMNKINNGLSFMS